ncbi:MAG: excisionase family protein [Methylomicrobium sp.]
MSSGNQFVTIEKCAELYGLTQEAIRQYKKKGQWREKIHWRKAPNGRIFINIKAVDAWIEGKGA